MAGVVIALMVAAIEVMAEIITPTTTWDILAWALVVMPLELAA
jgi:hypothetical protein